MIKLHGRAASPLARRATLALPRKSAMAASTTGMGAVSAGKYATVQALLESLSLQEKVAQITQLEVSQITSSEGTETGDLQLDAAAAARYAAQGIGSFLNSPTAGGARGRLVVPTGAQWRGFLQGLADAYAVAGTVPPVFGIDSVHGANYVAGAVLFPHSLVLAASFSRETAHAVGAATAQQSRRAGVPWVFGPLFDVAMHPRFARVYETFGEDPRVVSALALAMAQGMQGQALSCLHSGRPLAATAAAPPAQTALLTSLSAGAASAADQGSECSTEMTWVDNPVGPAGTGRGQPSASRPAGARPVAGTEDQASSSSSAISWELVHGASGDWPAAVGGSAGRAAADDCSAGRGETTGDERERSNQPSLTDAAACPIPEDLSSSDVVAACMKHFFAYQASRSGYDRAPVWVSELQAREYFLPPFEAAIRAGVATGMVAYNSVDGLPIVISRKWTQKWLRSEQDFEGMLVTDWQEVYNQLDWHQSASSGEEAVAQALLRSSTDMAMVPFQDHFMSDVASLLKQGLLTESRLDAAVLRVLELKHRLGLLGALVHGAPSAAAISSLTDPTPEQVAAHEELSKKGAREGITLIKNEARALPLSSLTSEDVIAVVGPNACARGNLLGGWSIHWQGPENDAEVPHVATVAEGFAASGAQIVSATGVDVNGVPAGHSAIECAQQATRAIVFVYGEGTYAEIFGDIAAWGLPAGQLDLARQLREVATQRGVPLVGVYVGGRDRLLRDIDLLLDAHLLAFYPGPFVCPFPPPLLLAQGADAIVDIVTGRCNPSGRLPITMHLDDTQTMPYWHTHSDYTLIPVKGQGGRKLVQPLYEFGHGLSYSDFAFSDLTIEVLRHPDNPTPDPPAGSDAALATTDFGPWDRVRVRVCIRNDSPMAGEVPVLLFVADEARIVPPEMKLLKAFQRASLPAGAACTAEFELGMGDFAFETNTDVLDKPGRMVQPGTFRIEIAGLRAVVNLVGSSLDERQWVRLSEYVL